MQMFYIILQEQFQFVHEVVKEYIRQNEIYSNFVRERHSITLWHIPMIVVMEMLYCEVFTHISFVFDMVAWF